MSTFARRAVIVGVLVVLGATARAVGDPSRNVTTYALVAARQLLGSSFTVRVGDVGVNEGRLRVSRGLGASGSQVAANVTDLGAASHCAALFSNFQLGAAPGCTGPMAFDGPLFADLGGACGFPTGTFPACDASKDVTVPVFGSTRLEPGAYGDVRIEGKNKRTGGILFLKAGAYRFCSIHAFHGAQLRFDGPAQVYVQGSVRFDTETFLGPSGPDAAPAVPSDQIELFVSDADVLFSHRADVRGQLCAPSSALRVKNRATLTGTFVADTIIVGRGAVVTRGGTPATTTTTTPASTSTSSSRTTTTSTSTTSTQPGTCTQLCGNGRLDASCGEQCDVGTGSAAGSNVGSCAPELCVACRCVVPTTSTTTSVTTTVTSSSSTSTTLPDFCVDACGDGILDEECGEECDGDDLGDAVCPGSPLGALVVDCPRCTADCRLDVTCCGVVVTSTSTSTSSSTTLPTTSSTVVTTTSSTSSTVRTTTTSSSTSTSRTSTTIAQTTTTSTSRTTSTSTSTSRTTSTSSSTSTSRSTTTTSRTTSSSTSTSRSTTSTSRTSTTSSSTSTTLGGGACPSRLRFTTTVGTTSCGGGAISPGAAAPFSGTIFDANGTRITDLGLSCLYVGGGGNTATAPNANPDGPSSLFTVTSCSGDTLNLAANAGTGAASCTQGTASTKHCTRTGIACTSDVDCGGSATTTGLCNPDPRCFFGPPLPIPAGPTSTCVLNVFRADASGTVNRAAGSSNISLPLASYVYLTGSATRVCANFNPGNDGLGACFSDAQCGGAVGSCQPLPACPRCVPSSTSSTGSRCLSGKRHGQECHPVGTKLTTLDCPPKDNIFIAPLNVTLAPLGTSTTTLTAAANGKFCPTATAATCTAATDPLHCQRTAGCFGRAGCRRIQENGIPAGSLTDNQPHPVTIAATFCIPATGNSLIDGGTGADLPGPGAVSIRGTFQTVP
jgi:hypothetical protein